MGVWYATREDVKRALDSAETARNNAQVDRAIESASRSIEGLLRRRFYPQTGTRYKDWPNRQYARSWRLWLDQDELVSVASLVAGGATISSADYFLEPANSGPPFTRIEVDLDSSAAFQSGNTHQRAIAITGVFGYSADEAPAGALAAIVSSTTATTINVTDSAAIGVGDIIRVDGERLIVTEKAMLDTGQNTSNLTAAVNDVAITGITAGTLIVGEIILIDSERMLVVDVAGTTVTVKRAWDGSVLAAHSSPTDIYAGRTLTVTRGALGTTAATHSNGAAIVKHVVPGLVKELCIAEAINSIQQETSGYAREVGEGENAREASGRGLRDIRNDALAAYGRKARSRAV